MTRDSYGSSIVWVGTNGGARERWRRAVVLFVGGLRSRGHRHGAADLLTDIGARCGDRVAQGALRQEPAERKPQNGDHGGHEKDRVDRCRECVGVAVADRWRELSDCVETQTAHLAARNPNGELGPE